MIPYSILDLAPIVEGGDAAQALRCSLDLSRHAERWGYHRYWIAEHHGMPGVASAATAVVISHIAAGTSRIRVGAGGIMLPNHAPLVIAEQFGTLESLFPGRIDLGLGRAPGTDALTRPFGRAADREPAPRPPGPPPAAVAQSALGISGARPPRPGAELLGHRLAGDGGAVAGRVCEADRRRRIHHRRADVRPPGAPALLRAHCKFARAEAHGSAISGMMDLLALAKRPPYLWALTATQERPCPK